MKLRTTHDAEDDPVPSIIWICLVGIHSSRSIKSLEKKTLLQRMCIDTQLLKIKLLIIPTQMVWQWIVHLRDLESCYLSWRHWLKLFYKWICHYLLRWVGISPKVTFSQMDSPRSDDNNNNNNNNNNEILLGFQQLLESNMQLAQLVTQLLSGHNNQWSVIQTVPTAGVSI